MNLFSGEFWQSRISYNNTKKQYELLSKQTKSDRIQLMNSNNFLF